MATSPIPTFSDVNGNTNSIFNNDNRDLKRAPIVGGENLWFSRNQDQPSIMPTLAPPTNYGSADLGGLYSTLDGNKIGGINVADNVAVDGKYGNLTDGLHAMASFGANPIGFGLNAVSQAAFGTSPMQAAVDAGKSILGALGLLGNSAPSTDGMTFNGDDGGLGYIGTDGISFNGDDGGLGAIGTGSTGSDSGVSSSGFGDGGDGGLGGDGGFGGMADGGLFDDFSGSFGDTPDSGSSSSSPSYSAPDYGTVENYEASAFPGDSYDYSQANQSPGLSFDFGSPSSGNAQQIADVVAKNSSTGKPGLLEGIFNNLKDGDPKTILGALGLINSLMNNKKPQSLQEQMTMLKSPYNSWTPSQQVTANNYFNKGPLVSTGAFKGNVRTAPITGGENTWFAHADGGMAGSGMPIKQGALSEAMHRGPGMVLGNGGGQDDIINAKLSNGEYVMDGDTVSALGDGSTQEGARKLDQMRENLRAHKRNAPKNEIPPKAKNLMQYMEDK